MANSIDARRSKELTRSEKRRNLRELVGRVRVTITSCDAGDLCFQ